MTQEERKEMLALMQEAIKPITDRLDTIEAKQDTMDAKQDTMDAKLTTMDAKQDTMEAKLTTMDAKQDTMEAKLDTMNERLSKVELTIENEINRAITIIAEGHTILNRKLDEKIALESRVEKLEHEMAAVNYRLKQA